MILFMNLLTNITTFFLVTGIDQNAAKTLIKKYTDPAISILLWVIPFACTIACISCVINWLGKSDEEKEQRRPGGVIKKIIFWSIVAESIVGILAIFGL